MHKWEYLKIYVEMTTDFRFKTKVGSEVISGKKVGEYIQSLGQVGWELVTVVERIGNEPPPDSNAEKVGRIATALMGAPTSYGSQHKPVTLGYFYHFKIEIIQNAAPSSNNSV